MIHRILEFSTLNLGIIPANVELDSAKQTVIVTWSDGHHSDYGYDWLQLRSFLSEEQLRRSLWYEKDPVVWKSLKPEEVPTFNCAKILEDDNELYKMTSLMEAAGLTVLHQTTAENLTRLNDKLSSFTDIGSSASQRFQPLHLDEAIESSEFCTFAPYYRCVPGLAILGCDQPVPELRFVDGFFIASCLQKESPEMFRELTSRQIEFCTGGGENISYDLISRHHTIRLEDGETAQIVYNNRFRDTFLCIPGDNVRKYYSALKAFSDLVQKPDHSTKLSLNQDDAVLVNNTRILCGRLGNKKSPPVEGIKVMTLMNMDCISSGRRLLKAKCNIPDDM